MFPCYALVDFIFRLYFIRLWFGYFFFSFEYNGFGFYFPKLSEKKLLSVVVLLYGGVGFGFWWNYTNNLHCSCVCGCCVFSLSVEVTY